MPYRRRRRGATAAKAAHVQASSAGAFPLLVHLAGCCRGARWRDLMRPQAASRVGDYTYSASTAFIAATSFFRWCQQHSRTHMLALKDGPACRFKLFHNRGECGSSLSEAGQFTSCWGVQDGAQAALLHSGKDLQTTPFSADTRLAAQVQAIQDESGRRQSVGPTAGWRAIREGGW